jgi:hypothetical protein
MISAISSGSGMRPQHLAGTRYYVEGRMAAGWPGHDKLVQQKLVADGGYVSPRLPEGPRHDAFTPHRLKDRCLMVSRLLTVDDFWEFMSIANGAVYALDVSSEPATGSKTTSAPSTSMMQATPRRV